MRTHLGVAVGLLLAGGFFTASIPAQAPPPEAPAQSALPDDAQKSIDQLDGAILEIQKKAQDEVLAAYEKCEKELTLLQEKYTKEGKLDEAVEIRRVVRMLRNGSLMALKDPGDLTNYRERVGEVLYFRVVGATGGKVFGDDVYTDDSHLATAAVHAGVLRFGDAGLVKVTILPGKSHYGSSEKNGVSTREWSKYEGSFRVEAVPPAPVAARVPAPTAE